jgi:hypothetical protein
MVELRNKAAKVIKSGDKERDALRLESEGFRPIKGEITNRLGGSNYLIFDHGVTDTEITDSPAIYDRVRMEICICRWMPGSLLRNGLIRYRLSWKPWEIHPRQSV